MEEKNINDSVAYKKEVIFKDYLDKMSKLYSAKNHDYGDSVSKTFDEYGLTSFLVRMDDKMNRIKTLNKSDDIKVRGEKIEDTLLDLANYAVLALTEIEYRKTMLLSEQSMKDVDITTKLAKKLTDEHYHTQIIH